jgi:hypothetical protein
LIQLNANDDNENLQIADASDVDDDDLSFTSLAAKAREKVDLKKTMEDSAKAKLREEKMKATEKSEDKPKEE